ESFFLEPNRLQNYFANHSQGDLSASIHSSFELAVNEISDYQAVRWALQRQATAWRNQSPWFGTTWTGKDSPLPEDLSFQSCVQNATQSRDFHSAAFANKLDLGGIAQEYRDRFAAPVANPVADYRWWYNGKDLQRVLTRHLSGFDFRKFYDWCIDRATIADYPDLQFINDYIGNLN
ncbi:hypothetical protein IT157_09310, partial [bacterium]|nr:hypothetical protein [bacterium]